MCRIFTLVNAQQHSFEILECFAGWAYGATVRRRALSVEVQAVRFQGLGVVRWRMCEATNAVRFEDEMIMWVLSKGLCTASSALSQGGYVAY